MEASETEARTAVRAAEDKVLKDIGTRFLMQISIQDLLDLMLHWLGIDVNRWYRRILTGWLTRDARDATIDLRARSSAG